MKQDTAHTPKGNVVPLRRSEPAIFERPTLRWPDGDDAERDAAREEQVGVLCAHHGYTLDGAVAEVLRREEREKLATAIAAKSNVATATPPASPATMVTLRALAAQWTTGELHEKYRDHIKKIEQQDNRERLEYVCRAKLDDGPYATVGDVPVADGVFTVEHALAGMSSLPAHLSPTTRAHVARALNRLLNLATFPCRLITRNPLPKGFVPPPAKAPARAWWRPEDDAKLCASRSIELVYRVFYGFTFREGCRESESGNATWGDVRSGCFTLDENKTDDPRSWKLHVGTPEALAAWRRIVAAAGLPTRDSDPIFVHVDGRHKGKRIHLAHLADDFRGHVTKADLWRPDFAAKKRDDGSAVRKQLDFHDLRGGFVTWALATGRTEAWVTDRTGHTSSAMLYRYKRRVRRAEEVEVEEPVSLLDAIPELLEVGAGSTGSGSSGNDRSAAPKRRSGGMADAADSKVPTPPSPSPDPDAEPPSSGVESALAYALREATRAGQWAAVAEIARALAVRRGQP